MFESVEIDGEPLKIPAILPRMEGSPGRTDWPGQDVGSHNAEVLGDILNLSQDEIGQLRSEGIIGGDS